MSEQNKAIYDLTRTDVVLARMCALILALMKEQGTIDGTQAAALVADAQSFLPEGHLMHEVFDGLKSELR